MKVIKSGTTSYIYGKGFKVYNKLAAKNTNYTVEYTAPPLGAGFFLEDTEKFTKPSFKTYGDTNEKIAKIMEAYKRSKNSVGVILSGAKGLGKTLFAKLLAIKAQEMGLPVILVNKGFPNISTFLTKIDQDSLIMFDEFDKNFNTLSVDENSQETGTESQDSMLSLFDGAMSQKSKHLYVLTVNNILDLSPYFLNRPGRFLFSIRLHYPSIDDIKIYLGENLNKKAQGQLNDILKFSFKVPLTYDSLSAIVAQANLGFKFKEIINDLNIMNLGSRVYTLKYKFKNGFIFEDRHVSLDLFEPRIKVNAPSADFTFNATDLVSESIPLYILGENVKHFEASGFLKDKVKEGLGYIPIERIELVPQAAEDFGFSNLN